MTTTPGHGDTCECALCERGDFVCCDQQLSLFLQQIEAREDPEDVRVITTPVAWVKIAALLAALLLLFVSLNGCAIAPDSIRPEVEHLSHLSQHKPFTDHPAHYGSDLVSVIARWDIRKAFYFEIGEGVALEKYDRWTQSYGELVGPREEFTARVGYIFVVPK